MHSSRMRTARSLTISWGAMHGGGVRGRRACEAGGIHGRGHVWQEVYMAGGHAWQGGMRGRGLCGEGHVWQGGMRGMHALPVDRMTDACKNITLPQTSLAGGNNSWVTDQVP